ncbi:MAG TPA: restriction endonuclease [Candidatus Angelobacter sp.]|nr:restriction endonuclease [Candidatus Angelobacter sp.]
MQLLRDTIPLLAPAKKDVLSFFKGAGVPEPLLSDLRAKLQADAKSVNKYEMVRVVLERLNEKRDERLRELREVIRRVTEFEDFSSCWPSDQLKAKGLVSEVRRVVNVKDSFTRMNMEREKEEGRAREKSQRKAKEIADRKHKIDEIRKDLYALFHEQDAHKRGKNLEGVLNRLFEAYGMLVREAFTVKISGKGVAEQIDGVVDIDGLLYLVEMKWLSDTLGTAEISQHIVRLYGRGGQTRGIFISYTDFTEGAISTCKDGLAGGVVMALCKLSEIVSVLERFEEAADLKVMFKKKIQAALLDKRPWSDSIDSKLDR